MEGLYRKIIKGRFRRIPSQYSDDLQRVLNMMIQQKPEIRPTCEDILNNGIVQTHMNVMD